MGSRRFKRDGSRPSRLVSAPGHHLQQETSEIFGFRNGRQNRMIRCLLEPAQTTRGATRVHKRIGDCLPKVLHHSRDASRRTSPANHLSIRA